MSTDSLQGQEWQSDVIVDLIKQCEFPHITLNPGASYRGLHDSLVNYGNNDPAMILCQHEKIAVQIAHGYAKTTGTPMVAIVTTSSACCTRRSRSTMPTWIGRRSLSSARPAPWT